MGDAPKTAFCPQQKPSLRRSARDDEAADGARPHTTEARGRDILPATFDGDPRARRKLRLPGCAPSRLPALLRQAHSALRRHRPRPPVYVVDAETRPRERERSRPGRLQGEYLALLVRDAWTTRSNTEASHRWPRAATQVRPPSTRVSESTASWVPSTATHLERAPEDEPGLFDPSRLRSLSRLRRTLEVPLEDWSGSGRSTTQEEAIPRVGGRLRRWGRGGRILDPASRPSSTPSHAGCHPARWLRERVPAHPRVAPAYAWRPRCVTGARTFCGDRTKLRGGGIGFARLMDGAPVPIADARRFATRSTRVREPEPRRGYESSRDVHGGPRAQPACNQCAALEATAPRGARRARGGGASGGPARSSRPSPSGRTSAGREVCPRCGAVFARLAALVTHVEREHEGGASSGKSSSQCRIS